VAQLTAHEGEVRLAQRRVTVAEDAGVNQTDVEATRLPDEGGFHREPSLQSVHTLAGEQRLDAVRRRQWELEAALGRSAPDSSVIRDDTAD